MAHTLIAPPADAGLLDAVRSGERLVAQATAQGLACALDELGDITLPDPVSARIDKAQLQALASLYLAANLESAGVIPAVEALAGLLANGSAGLDMGAAEPMVGNWWRHRADRLSVAERVAFFARLFGTATGPMDADAGRNTQFEDRMLELCEALYKLDETPGADLRGTAANQARVRSAARAMAQNLGAACTGVTAFMAGEVITMLKDAVAILGQADLRHCFQARDIWGVVSGVARLTRVQPSAPADHVRRGKAGLTLLAWLADVAGTLGGAGLVVTTDHPVVSAAADWMEATLRLGENGEGAPQAQAQAPTASPRAAPVSSWADLGR